MPRGRKPSGLRQEAGVEFYPMSPEDLKNNKKIWKETSKTYDKLRFINNSKETVKILERTTYAPSVNPKHNEKVTQRLFAQFIKIKGSWKAVGPNKNISPILLKEKTGISL